MSLFSFLDALLCTTGALILVLVCIAQHARDRKVAEAAEVARKAAAGPPLDQLQEQQAEMEWRLARLRESRDATAQKLDQQRSELSHLEDHARRLKKQLEELAAAEAHLEPTAAPGNEELDRLREQLARLEALFGQKQEALEKTIKESGDRTDCYAIIPYHGPHETRRRPIYIECCAEGVIFQPEGIVLREDDFMGDLGPSNPLALALRAAREQLSRKRAAGYDEGSPYPLLLVRPNGIAAYLAASEAMASWASDFGYELVEQDWNLEYPPPDPTVSVAMEQAVQEGRRRQQYLLRAAPRLMSQGPRPVFRAAPSGGLPRDGGDSQLAGADGNSGAGRRGSGGTRSGSGDVLDLDGGSGDGFWQGGGDGGGLRAGGSSKRLYADALAKVQHTGSGGSSGEIAGAAPSTGADRIGSDGAGAGSASGANGRPGRGAGNSSGGPTSGTGQGSGADGSQRVFGATGNGSAAEPGGSLLAANGNGMGQRTALGGGGSSRGGSRIDPTGGLGGGQQFGADGLAGGGRPGGGGRQFGADGLSGGGQPGGAQTRRGAIGSGRLGGGVLAGGQLGDGQLAGGQLADRQPGGGQPGGGQGGDAQPGGGQGGSLLGSARSGPLGGGRGAASRRGGVRGANGTLSGAAAGGSDNEASGPMPTEQPLPSGARSPFSPTNRFAGGGKRARGTAAAGRDGDSASGSQTQTGAGGDAASGIAGDPTAIDGANGPGGQDSSSGSTGPGGAGTAQGSPGGGATSGASGRFASNTWGRGARGTGGSASRGGSGPFGQGGSGSGSSANSSSAGSPAGAMMGSSAGQPIMGGMPTPNLTLGQQSNDNPQSMAKSRGDNWASRNVNSTMTQVERPIRIKCDSDHLTLLPDRGSRRGLKVVELAPSTEDSIDPLVVAVWKRVDSWGTPGEASVWQPTLVFEVAPGGEKRFAELKTLLSHSGLTVKSKPAAVVRYPRTKTPR